MVPSVDPEIAKINLEYLKLLIDREAKQSDRSTAWHNLFLTINGALIAACITLHGQTDGNNRLICAISFVGIIIVVVWYQVAAKLKMYHFARQQDLARFVVANNISHIFNAESEISEKPKIYPHLESVAISHVMSFISTLFFVGWIVLAFALILSFIR